MEKYLAITIVLFACCLGGGYFTMSIVDNFKTKHYFSCGIGIVGAIYMLTKLIQFAITY